jgi:hypothetical protein
VTGVDEMDGWMDDELDEEAEILAVLDLLLYPLLVDHKHSNTANIPHTLGLLVGGARKVS